MRKTLNVVLAVVLALAMFASVAYVADPDRTSEYQLSLVSAKAVTVQDATQGVRSYSDIVDASKGFQVNEVIHLAISAEVKNLEKPASNNKLKSISGKTIKVVVGSPSIDLSVARLNTPTLLAHVWSGYTGQNVATVGYVLAAGDILSYDKATNEISWKFKGYDQYAMPRAAQLGYNLVDFTPYLVDGKIAIPAIKLKDQKDKWTLGTYTYDATYEAPESVAYTMVLQGVTKDNAGAATGDFYAKIEVSAAEKFEDYGKYYVDQVGNAASSVDKLKIGGGGLSGKGPYEWLDYVEIDVDKLEVAGAYNVYRYDIPASAVMSNIPVIYDGDYDDFAGYTLAHVQPQTWDYDTNKDVKNNAVTQMDVAGGVKSVKAFDNYVDSSQSNYPITSVVYSANKAYYAPGYYGISGTQIGRGDIYGSDPVQPKFGTSNSTSKVTVIDHYYFDLPAGMFTSFHPSNVQVWKADQIKVTSTNHFLNPANNATWLTPAAGAGSVSDTGLVNAFDPAVPGFEVNSTLTLDAIYNKSYKQSPHLNGYATNQGTATATDKARLSKDVEYAVDWVTPKAGDTHFRVTVTPIEKNITNAYPLQAEGGLSGNQWVVFYYQTNLGGIDIKVPYSALNQRDKLFTPHVAVADTNGGPWQIAPVTRAAAPIDVDGTSQIEEWSSTSAGDPADLLAGKLSTTHQWTTSNADRYTLLNAEASRVAKYWPVFKEVTKEVDMAGTSSAAIYAPIVEDTSAAAEVTKKPIPLSYVSQVTDVFFFDRYADHGTMTYSSLGFYDADLDNWKAGQSDLLDYLNGEGDYTSATKWIPGNGLTPASGAVLFTRIDSVGQQTNGDYYVQLGGAYAYNGTKWSVATATDLQYNDLWTQFTIDLGKVETVAYSDKKAAPFTIWDIDSVAKANQDVRYHNGIVVYTITNNTSDRPWVSMATESTTYDSDDGYGLALFDGYNATKTSQDKMGLRVYRSNDSNLTYGYINSTSRGHVNESASMIAAMKYFGLDTSYGTTFRVTDDAFESKGAAAVYSENINGSFKYGNLTIISEEVDEGTDETTVDDADTEPVDNDTADDEMDAPADDDSNDDDSVDDGSDDEPMDDGEDTEGDDVADDAPTNTAPVVVKTGDGSANIAIALAAAAVVAAAGLAFVMKKVR